MPKNSTSSKEEIFKKDSSDGWHYQIGFRNKSDEEVLSELRTFLVKTGYNDIPLPKTAERLWWDYLNPNSFSNGMYVYHPIIISASAYHEHAITLSIYNENYPNHKELWRGILLKEK